MNASMGKHLQFLTQMAMDSTTMKLLYRNINKHYMQVEILVKQMAAEIDRQKNKDGQQEILESISLIGYNQKCRDGQKVIQRRINPIRRVFFRKIYHFPKIPL